MAYKKRKEEKKAAAKAAAEAKKKKGRFGRAGNKVATMNSVTKAFSNTTSPSPDKNKMTMKTSGTKLDASATSGLDLTRSMSESPQNIGDGISRADSINDRDPLS